VAKVNGEPITRERLAQCLVEAHGRRMLQQLVALEVVRQQLRARGLTVGPQDIDAEEAEETRQFDPNDRPRRLAEYIVQKGMTRVEWRLAMEINAGLRKLASMVPEPTEEQLRQLFNRRYGDRVVVRVIQVKTPADMAAVKARLAAKEAFEVVASGMSEDAPTKAAGGMLPPFDRDDPTVAEPIRAAAFALDRDLAVSGEITVGGLFHILQRVRRLPPEAKRFQDVRPELATELRNQRVIGQMLQLLPMLRDSANVEVLDPVLKEQVEPGGPGEPAPGGGAGPPPQPASGAAGPVVARVNGEAIARERLLQYLIEAHGRRILQHLIALDVVRQRVRAGNMTVTPADVAAEEKEWIPPEIMRYEPKDRVRLLDAYLESHSLTRVDWRLMMEMYANLRKAAPPVPAPNEDQLRQLFNRVYGERVAVRAIQVRTLEEMAAIDARLDRGEEFHVVARSTPGNRALPATGGLLPEFDRNDQKVSAEIRAVAFAMARDLAVSGWIKAGEFYFKIQRLRRVAPENVTFEAVRDKLAADIHRRLAQMQMQALLPTMVNKAAIQVLDPMLRQQIEQGRAAESQPGGPRSQP
jgi:parvulin-like peptidyl-prolyl isomerase